MKTPLIFFCIFVISIFTDVCGDSSQGELIKESTKTYVVENLDHKTDFNGKRIAIDGYIYIGGTAEQEGSKLTLTIFTKPKGEGDALVQFETGDGDSKNTVTLPLLKNGKNEGYRTTRYDVDADKMKFTDNDGVVHPITDKVRVSANLEYIETFNHEFSHTPDPMHENQVIYSFYLKNTRFDSVK